MRLVCYLFFEGGDGRRDRLVTGIQTCALPILALRLLIERGNIPNLEKDVMSGAVFHNCSWPDKWSSDKSAEVAFAQDNWFRIKKNGGKWSFTSAALKH